MSQLHQMESEPCMCSHSKDGPVLLLFHPLFFNLAVSSQTVSQHFAVSLHLALGTCSYCGSSAPSTDWNVLTWMEKSDQGGRRWRQMCKMEERERRR